MSAHASVVIATRNRVDTLEATLCRLTAMSDAPSIIVVDNDSTDGTAGRLRRHWPDVELVSLTRNAGAAARNVGARRARTEVVAFSDDDSWWADGSLLRAARLFHQEPGLGVLAGRVLVGAERMPDPVSDMMARGPLADDLIRSRRGGRPGVIGFLACGSVVRRAALLSVGGFPSTYGVGGEEELLALDLAAAGWRLAYEPSLVAHHHPSAQRNPERRRRLLARNAVWTALSRYSLGGAAWRVRRALARADRHALIGAADGFAGWRWPMENRAPVPRHVEAAARLLAG